MIRLTQGWFIVASILLIEIINGVANTYEYIRTYPVSAIGWFVAIFLFSAVCEWIMDVLVYNKCVNESER